LYTGFFLLITTKTLLKRRSISGLQNDDRRTSRQTCIDKMLVFLSELQCYQLLVYVYNHLGVSLNVLFTKQIQFYFFTPQTSHWFYYWRWNYHLYHESLR